MKRTVVHVTAGRWPGSLVVVTETTAWGVQGYVPMPHRDEDGDVVGRAYVRVVNGAFDVVGEIEVDDE
jgi:hypothetical protein